MKRRSKIIVFVIATIACIACFLPVISSCSKPVVAHLIVLAGQSNCEGVARSDALALKIGADRYETLANGVPNVYLTRPSSGVHISDFVPCKLGQGTSDSHFGIEIGMAEYLSEHFHDEQFFLVKKAHGGTPIDLWRNVKPWDSAYSYFVGLVDDVKKAIETLRQQGYSVVVEAFCWMQGESDADDIERAQTYLGKLSSLADDFRNEFAQYNSSVIRFVDGGISDATEVMPYYETVNNAKKEVAGKSEYNYFIDTIAMHLTKNGDSQGDLFHYDSLSMLRLGREFGKLAIGGDV